MALDLSDELALNRLPPELERLTSLQSLSLAGCQQLSGDLSPLSHLTSLQSLFLQLSRSFVPLDHLTSLNCLYGCRAQRRPEQHYLRENLLNLRTLDPSRLRQAQAEKDRQDQSADR